jgi:hypothetical protein
MGLRLPRECPPDSAIALSEFPSTSRVLLSLFISMSCLFIITQILLWTMPQNFMVSCQISCTNHFLILSLLSCTCVLHIVLSFHFFYSEIFIFFVSFSLILVMCRTDLYKCRLYQKSSWWHTTVNNLYYI